MNKMLAYCGLACDSCPIHLATFEKDKSRQQEMRVSIASFISEHYQMSLKVEDITDCDGCGANTGRLFSQCRNCEIRKCAIHRDIESCAHCPDYACDKLTELFSRDPAAQAHLEELRR
jgi:hypothetical protein